MFSESDDRDDVAHHVEQEGAEVACQRDDQQTLRDVHREVVREDSEAIPDVLRQRFNRVIRQGSSTAEIENNRENPDDRRNDAERPDRPVRGQVFRMEHPQIPRQFIIASHREGDAGSGIDAGERRADERQKHGDALQ